MSRQVNIIAVAVSFVFLLCSYVFCEESITITTYYPSPYGSYNDLYVANSLGVGATTPLVKLHVAGGSVAVGAYLETSVAGGQFTSADSSWLMGGRRIYALDGLRSDGDIVAETGNVGIGVVSPSYKLQLSTDSAAKPTSNTWTISSDRRLKKNIKPLKGALVKMTKLHGVTYQWNEPEKFGNMTSTYMGLIGQDVEEVFPEWVSTDKSGYKNLTISGFEALTAESIRELKAQNDALRAKNIQLENRIKRLEEKLKL